MGHHWSVYSVQALSPEQNQDLVSKNHGSSEFEEQYRKRKLENAEASFVLMLCGSVFVFDSNSAYAA